MSALILWSISFCAVLEVPVGAIVKLALHGPRDTGERPGVPFRYDLADGDVIATLDPAQKGFFSWPTGRGVQAKFTVETLKAFLRVDKLLLTPEALRLLRTEDCEAEIDGSEFAVNIDGAREAFGRHTIKSSVARRFEQAWFEFGSAPRVRYGLVLAGRVSYNGPEGLISLNDHLYLQDRSKSYGFEMICGHLRISANGNCTVHRDYHRRVHGSYTVCEAMLPYWRELDALYFEIVRRVVTHPVITTAYRL